MNKNKRKLYQKLQIIFVIIKLILGMFRKNSKIILIIKITRVKLKKIGKNIWIEVMIKVVK